MGTHGDTFSWKNQLTAMQRNGEFQLENWEPVSYEPPERTTKQIEKERTQRKNELRATNAATRVLKARSSSNSSTIALWRNSKQILGRNLNSRFFFSIKNRFFLK